MDDRTIDELLQGLPPRARAGVRAALRAADDETNVEDDVVKLGKLAAAIAGGSNPALGLIIGGIQGLVGLLKYGAKKRKAKRQRSRRRGTAAGLAAYQASRHTQARAHARGAGKSLRRRR
jgi:hypothetical protein